MPSSLLDSFKSANTELNAESFIEAMPPEVGTCEAATAAAGREPELRLAFGGLEAVVAAGGTSRVCCRLTGDRACGVLLVVGVLLAP